MARNDARERDAFMEHCRQVILERGDSHPLRHVYLDESGNWNGPRTAENMDVPTAQAGHTTTRGYSDFFREEDGRTRIPTHDRYALEDPMLNVDLGGRAGEGDPRRTKFHIISRDTVDIEGVPVDRRTAEMLERTGELHVPGGVASLPRTEGWQPPWARDPAILDIAVGSLSVGVTSGLGLVPAVIIGAATFGLMENVARAAESTDVTTGAKAKPEDPVVQDKVQDRKVGGATGIAGAQGDASVAGKGQDSAKAQDAQTPASGGGNSSSDSAGGLPAVSATMSSVPADIPPPVATEALSAPAVSLSAGGVPDDVPPPVQQAGDFPTPEPPHAPDLPPESAAPAGQIPQDEVPPNMMA